MFSINDVVFDVDYHIKHEYDGNKTLYFTLSPEDERYQLVREEMIIKCDGLYYIIKSVDEQSSEVKVECPLCLDSLKDRVYTSYVDPSITLSQVFSDVLEGTGWRAIDAELVTESHELKMSDVTRLQVLEGCRKVYNVVYEYDNSARTVKVIKPENILPKDVYITDQLNLRKVDYKGDSYDFVTRLYPYGKTTKNKDGSETVVSIASVNNGSEYIDNQEYCNKIIAAVWRDQNYTDAQQLKDDAIEKLKVLAQPVVSYELDVADLAKINPKYESLSFQIYDIVTLIDRRRKTKVDHRVVEVDEYPYHPEDNKITLSTVPQKIEGILSSVISQINSDSQVNKTKYNEIKQDLDSTVSTIGEMYTKGETDQKIQSQVSQSINNLDINFINGKISSDTVFSPNGMDIYNGSLQIWKYSKGSSLNSKPLFFFDKDNGYLGLEGKIVKTDSNKNILQAITIGISENGDDYGGIKFDDNEDGYGTIFSAYRVLFIGAQQEKGVVWTAPFLNNISDATGKVLNRKGIAISPNSMMFFADDNGIPKGVKVYSDTGNIDLICNALSIDGPIQANGQITGTISSANRLTASDNAIAVGIGNGNEIGIASSAPDLWFNYRYAKDIPGCSGFSGYTASIYRFGNGTKGGYGDIYAGSIYSNGVSVTSDRSQKKNISDYGAAVLSKLKSLKFYSYDLKARNPEETSCVETEESKPGTKSETEPSSKTKHVAIGIMADEAPSEILVGSGKAVDLYQYLNLLAKAVQELSDTVERQQREIEKWRQGTMR